jgi:hypothetical protein
MGICRTVFEFNVETGQMEEYLGYLYGGCPR